MVPTEATPDVAFPSLPRGLAVFRQLLAFIGRLELLLAILALVMVVAISAAQAFLRYFFGTSLWWAQEIAETAIMVCYFLGISYVFKTRQEIYIEFVSSMLPVRMQLVLYMFEQLLAVAFTASLLWLAYLFSPTLFNMQTPMLKLPAAVTFGPLIASSSMIALTSIYHLIFGIWAFRNRLPGRFLTDIEQHGLILAPLRQEL